MRLNITYTAQPQPKKEVAQAAFIHSNDPRVWLTELSRWGHSAADWACYAVPESVQSVAVSGLFVVTEKLGLDVISPNLMWFNRVGERLFVPINAQLTPSVSEAELAKILIFDVQFFHPTIGFVGFNPEDRLDLTKLLDLSIADNSDWTRAYKGVQPCPRLNQISILPPSGKDVVNSFKDGLEQKPLKDIPFKDGSTKNDEKSAFDKLMDNFKEQLLRGGLAAVNGLNSILPENTTGKEGLLDAPFRWLNDRMAALEQQRESELQRLLDMFKDNPDEALKYALPLNNPYSERGTATPSGGLGTRSTDFNLGGIGGGQAVDAWSTDKHYHDLRKKYIDAANRAIENDDFRRAAYIYAHLLGDFSSAANVLEQGGFYREAAALHRDHLNNIAGAALCLEKGKLYLEAIELYQKLEQDEKVGDLYQTIGQDKNAAFYYEKCVERALKQQNFIEVARLENQKLANPARAKATLLRGWSEASLFNTEACLRQYFDLMMLDSDEEAARQIEPIFKNSPEQPLSFLSVLVNVNHKYSNPHFQKAARPIAYQIVSKEAAQGNRAVIKDLEHFFPEDALIGKDTARFMHQKPRLPKEIAPKSFKMPHSKGIFWEWAFSFYDSFVCIAIGLKDGDEDTSITIVRSNWTGSKMQVQTVDVSIEKHYQWNVISNQKQQVKDLILIWGLDRNIEEFSALLNQDNPFSTDLQVFAPVWMPDNAIAAGIYEGSQVIVLRHLEDSLALVFYSTEGVLLKSVACVEDSQIFYVEYLWEFPLPLLFYQSISLFYNEDCLFLIDLEGEGAGEVDRLYMGNIIEKLVQSSFEKNIFILDTHSGLFVFDIKQPNFQDSLTDASFFGQDLKVQDILFVSPTHFVVLQDDEALVFAQTENSATQTRKIALKANAKSLLRTNEQHQFAVLYEDGLVAFFEWM